MKIGLLFVAPSCALLAFVVATTTTTICTRPTCAATAEIWSYTTIWSPYYAYWPVVYHIRNPFVDRWPSTTETAQNRLFPTHPKQGAIDRVAVRPEHRLIDEESDKGTVVVHDTPVHRSYSYMSSSPSPYASVSGSAGGRSKRRAAVTTADLPISSTSIIFPSRIALPSSVPSRERNETTKGKGGKQPTKTEGKLVLEGLSLLGSLLRPGSGIFRPGGLLSSSSTIQSPILAAIHGAASGAFPSASSPSSAMAMHHHYPSYPPMPHMMMPFLYPGSSAFYPNAMYPSSQATSPYYSTVPSPVSPYQALSVDNLLVPLVGMVGLNLLRPDIVRSRREGGPSDIDGIDVFRQMALDDKCLRRLACEVGVAVTAHDDTPTIQRAIERAMAAKRLVPSHHVSKESTNKNRSQCGRHSCDLWRTDAADHNRPSFELEGYR